jgi:hypothetical protein
LFALVANAPQLLAQSTGAVPAQPMTDCRQAARSFEESARLPAGLLQAIGQVESGRADPLTGQVEPWPWAANHAGEGHYFASAQEAVAWVTAQQAARRQSIDVGCFQVNLYYHPDAFTDLVEAFDPTANARYAAALLNRLHDQSGSWAAAIALYHSADPLEGQRYSARVMTAWNGDGGIVAAPPVANPRPAATVAVLLAAAASNVRVIVPDWAIARPIASAPQHIVGLPKVVTPGR